MAFIRTIPPGESKDAVREMYQRQQAAFGYVPNYAKVFCHRPEVMERWATLLAATHAPSKQADVNHSQAGLLASSYNDVLQVRLARRNPTLAGNAGRIAPIRRNALRLLRPTRAAADRPICLATFPLRSESFAKYAG
jgi:hypothetical protein